MAPPPIDVLECSSSELAEYLLKHRFEDDGMATTAFLLEGTTTLPNADVIAAQIQEGAQSASPQKDTKAAALVSSQSEESSSGITHSLGKAHHSIPLEISLTNPRGKFNLTLHEKGVYAATVKNPQPLILSAGCVGNVIVFPKPSDCKPTSKKATAPPTPMMLLCFQDEDDNNKVTFKNKPLSQICFPVPTSLECLQETEEEEEGTEVVDAWIQLICRSLEIDPHKSVYRIENPAYDTATNSKEWAFQSHQEPGKSKTTDGMPFVNCYFGVQDGCLFPLKEGLFFFKPPLFIPRSNLHSIACGRGAGASSRYVDMNIQIQDESSIEFTNIHREEIGVLNDYIHKTLIPAMQEDAQQDDNVDGDSSSSSNGEEAEAAMVVEVEGNAEEAVEVQVDTNDSDSDEIEVVQVKSGRGCRSKRRAARVAMQQTEQHYLQKQKNGGNDDDEEEDDSGDDAAYQVQAGQDYDDGDHDMEEEDDYEPEGKGGDDDDDDDDDDDESDGNADVVVEEDDETEEDEEEEGSSPPKKKRRGR